MPASVAAYKAALQPVTIGLPATGHEAGRDYTVLISQAEARVLHLAPGDLVRYSPHFGAHEQPPEDPVERADWSVSGCIATRCVAKDAACTQDYRHGVFEVGTGKARSADGAAPAPDALGIEGRNSLEQSPDRGFVRKEYSVTRKLSRSTDAMGNTSVYTYDALDRLTQLAVYALAAGFNPATYNSAGAAGVPRGALLRTVKYVHAPGVSSDQQPINVTEATGNGGASQTLQTTTYTYDALGRVLTQSVKTATSFPVLPGGTTTGALFTPAFESRYSYDSASGLLASVTYPSGRSVNYSYDRLGRVTQATTTAPATQGGGQRVLVGSVSYRADGQISSYTLGNNRTVSRSYNADGDVIGCSLVAHSASLIRDPAVRILGHNLAKDTQGAASPDSVFYADDPLDHRMAEMRISSASDAALWFEHH